MEEPTLSLFAKAGFRFYGASRSLWLVSNDQELKPVLLRPQEIPKYVADGSLDCGLAGWDWIKETNSQDSIQILADLCYSKRTFRPVRWVLAVPEDSHYKTVNDLKKNNSPIRISTEIVDYTRSWLSERGVIANVSFSWGATEAKVPVFADAIVDCTETGSSLRANKLRIIETVIESTTRFFANKKAYRKDEWKKSKFDDIALLLKSCLSADSKVALHARTPKSKIDKIKSLIPEDSSYSVWEGEDDMMIMEVIIDRELARSIVPALANNGAQKISLSPLGMLYE